MRAARRVRAYPLLRLGQMSSSRPLSRASGFDRGTPVDRYYIERFLADHSADIRGRVLEVGEDVYSRRFGGGRVERQDILHIDDSNAAATLVGDLADPRTLPSGAFDCIILAQTLQYVFDLPAAVRTIRRALRPGGVALITVPGVAPISLDDWRDFYYWRFTGASLDKLLNLEFEASNIAVSAFGNLYAATHFLHGAAVEEVGRKKLQGLMPEYAIVIAARVVA
jgi:SAM-dependent methyltransferase